MKRKLTIKEIAAELQLSRNTVSKVLSGKSGVSEKTTKLVLDYIGTADDTSSSAAPAKLPFQKGSIMFTYHLENTEYLNNLLAGIERTLKKNGYALVLNIVRDGDDSDITIPPSLYDGSIAGIISFNIFNVPYWEEIIALDIPSVFVDTFANSYLFSGRTDIVATENANSVHEIMDILIKQGRKNFGFVGYTDYCFSIAQRWHAFRDALTLSHLPYHPENCITEDLTRFSVEECISYIKERLTAMERLPDAFLCVNDLHAIELSSALKELNYKIPDQVSVVGFDNLSEAARQFPSITTVDAHSEYLGRQAAHKVLNRIKNPSLPYEFTQYQTDIILRESTRPITN
ncbi:LacI family DNA-binding transcriptional regulator [Lachnospiraceae bacterium ASD3451]|uniref:LacI family DNA-binding transcriptional regulator n=1 Tax=Diplocloster agilis TaxID=2850323 RepID=UPI001DA87F0B|nr:LacI family DNA-binding transcriptional regulator [Diplocloster agilis]MBU9744949.1 LacI family DNA-binding transcriptional regulator [Diplocloster agilis]